ncbi:hypothetical protein [Streptomyces griseorubiginosus]
MLRRRQALLAHPALDDDALHATLTELPERTFRYWRDRAGR